eukprot:14606070-Alexandrium_andersonii.AAC.1
MHNSQQYNYLARVHSQRADSHRSGMLNISNCIHRPIAGCQLPGEKLSLPAHSRTHQSRCRHDCSARGHLSIAHVSRP